MIKLLKRTKDKIINLMDDTPPVSSKQIHSDFDNAAESLLIETENDTLIEKGNRLKNLGFYRNKLSKMSHEIENKNSYKQVAEYFRIHYPNNKYITHRLIEKICERHGLFFGEADRFIGDIPEKNLKEIESFKLRDDDKIKIDCGFYERSKDGFGYCKVNKETPYSAYGYLNYWHGGLVITEKSVTHTYYTPPLEVVASIRDFDTENMVIRDGYRLEVDDPIVLQPVKDGYLIITAWGDEASDELVINEAKN